MRYYIVYETRNLLNGMVYRGVHQTENLNDGYLGSGSDFKKAVKLSPNKKKDFKRYTLAFAKDEREMYFIEKFFVNEEWMNNETNYNQKIGGTGSCKLSKKTKNKMSEAKRGVIFSEEHKKNLSESHIGKICSEETKRKMSEAGKVKIFTEETRKKISEANKGKYHTEETKIKISERQKGKYHPHIGIPKSEETKLKISLARKEYFRVKKLNEAK